MSSLCSICQALPWHQFARDRKFRYAWWIKESLLVPYDDSNAAKMLPASVTLLPPTPAEASKSKREDRFFYYKEAKEIKAASVKGCHICRFVWRGFLEYSMDDFRLTQEEDLLECLEKKASHVHVVHKPTSGDLEFCFNSENVCRTVTLRYYFISSKQEYVYAIAKAQRGIQILQTRSFMLLGQSLASQRDLHIPWIQSTIGLRNVKSYIKTVLSKIILPRSCQKES